MGPAAVPGSGRRFLPRHPARQGGRRHRPIDRFTKTGIKLDSGEELQADIIITATGLNMQLLGGVQPTRNGEPFDLTSLMTYKGLMFSGVPNFAITFGYTNAS